MTKQTLTNYVYNFLHQYKLYIFSLFIIAILSASFDILFNYKVKEIMDSITNNPGINILPLVASYSLYRLAHHMTYFVRRLADLKYQPEIISNTVTDVYTKVTNHSLHWFDSRLSGEIAKKIFDFQKSTLVIVSDLFTVFRLIMTLIISLVFLLQINWHVTVILMSFTLIYIPVMYVLMSKQMKLQEQYVQAKQHTSGIVNDSIANIFSIKVIGNLSTEFNLTLRPAINSWTKWYRKTKKFDTYYVDIADTIMSVILGAIQLYTVSYLYQNGTITGGDFIFISTLSMKIYWIVENFLEHLLFHLNPSIASLKTSFAFVNENIEVQDKDDPVILNNVSGAVEYKNVSFTYDNDRDILDNFSLKIKPKEKIGIVGLSGAGKTTMMKCLLRYFDISRGTVSIDNHNIKDISQESLRKSIAIIPQDISMFHRTVKENIQMARSDASDQEIIEACKKAKIHDDILKMSHGYNTIVGEKGTKLSGGQRQRVAIARAILKNSPILILDEATSSLDTITEKLIQDAINQMMLSNESTVIAIAHRLSTLKYMDRIIVLDKGRIIQEGTHHSLLQDKGNLYSRLWNMQTYHQE